MDSYFVADTHFGHDKIIEYCNRPFANAKEMDEALVDYWNETVSPKDVVYHVGDFSLYKTTEEITKLVKRLHGQVHLTWGNHDDRPVKRAKGFAWQGELKRLRLRNQKITVCHYPMEGWWARRKNSWMVHGDSHGNMPVRGLRLDVGVDCWNFRPIHFDQISEIMKRRMDASEYYSRTILNRQDGHA